MVVRKSPLSVKILDIPEAECELPLTMVVHPLGEAIALGAMGITPKGTRPLIAKLAGRVRLIPIESTGDGTAQDDAKPSR